jgi:hypothetical protein
MGNRLCACAILLLVACAHSNPNTVPLDVRATTSGKGRSFEFDPARGELIAWGNNGRLLQLWVHASELLVGAGTRRAIPEGCRAGFLSRTAADGSAVLVEIHLCPRRDAPAGWQGWHADFELHADAETAGTLPPKADFAVGWDRELHELRLSSQVFRATMTVPNASAAPVRSYPELFALAVLLGVVPFAPDGKYQVE